MEAAWLAIRFAAFTVGLMGLLLAAFLPRNRFGDANFETLRSRALTLAIGGTVAVASLLSLVQPPAPAVAAAPTKPTPAVAVPAPRPAVAAATPAQRPAPPVGTKHDVLVATNPTDALVAAHLVPITENRYPIDETRGPRATLRLEPGSYEVVVMAEGYVSRSLPVDVPRQRSLAVALKPEPAPAPTEASSQARDAEPGSAEAAFLAYLDAWRRKDWNSMAALALPSWRELKDDPAAELEAMFGFKDVVSFRVVEAEDNSEVSSRVTAEVTYRLAAEKTVLIQALLLREAAPRELDPSADWSLNPVATTSERTP